MGQSISTDLTAWSNLETTLSKFPRNNVTRGNFTDKSLILSAMRLSLLSVEVAMMMDGLCRLVLTRSMMHSRFVFPPGSYTTRGFPGSLLLDIRTQITATRFMLILLALE